ncbi:kelch repeat-containing protein [Myxococcota bacterium]
MLDDSLLMSFESSIELYPGIPSGSWIQMLDPSGIFVSDIWNVDGGKPHLVTNGYDKAVITLNSTAYNNYLELHWFDDETNSGTTTLESMIIGTSFTNVNQVVEISACMTQNGHIVVAMEAYPTPIIPTPEVNARIFISRYQHLSNFHPDCNGLAECYRELDVPTPIDSEIVLDQNGDPVLTVAGIPGVPPLMPIPVNASDPTIACTEFPETLEGSFIVAYEQNDGNYPEYYSTANQLRDIIVQSYSFVYPPEAGENINYEIFPPNSGVSHIFNRSNTPVASADSLLGPNIRSLDDKEVILTYTVSLDSQIGSERKSVPYLQAFRSCKPPSIVILPCTFKLSNPLKATCDYELIGENNLHVRSHNNDYATVVSWIDPGTDGSPNVKYQLLYGTARSPINCLSQSYNLCMDTQNLRPYGGAVTCGDLSGNSNVFKDAHDVIVYDVGGIGPGPVYYYNKYEFNVLCMWLGDGFDGSTDVVMKKDIVHYYCEHFDYPLYHTIPHTEVSIGSVGVDLDQDGYINNYDCQGLNKHLGLDLDGDSRCDSLPSGNHDIQLCIDECLALYTQTDPIRPVCISKCDLDNCQYDTEFSVTGWADNRHPNREQCIAIRDCMDSNHPENWQELMNCTSLPERAVCETIFQNPNQEDSDGDGIGDRCDPNGSTHFIGIGEFGELQVDWGSHGSWIGVCADPTVDLTFRTVGGLLRYFGGPLSGYANYHIEDGQLVFGPLLQRMSVGACECHDPVSCDLICPRAAGEEFRGGVGSTDFAYDPIYAVEGVNYPEFNQGSSDWGDVNYGEDGEVWDHYFHNKSVEFLQNEEESLRTLSWNWSYGHHKDLDSPQSTIDLNGLEVWLRVAHRDPSSQSVTENVPAFLAEGIEPVLIPTWGGCQMLTIPFEVHLVPWFLLDPWFAWGGFFNTVEKGNVHLMLWDTIAEEGYLAQYGTMGRPPKSLSRVTSQAGATRQLPVENLVTTSGYMDSALVGVPNTERQVLFFYGGVDATGVPEGELWFGIPSESESLMLYSRDVYETMDATTPRMDEPTLIFDKERTRLLVLGQPVDGGVEGVSEIWSFDLATGRWNLERRMYKLNGLSGYSVVLDARRQRAFIFGGQYGGKTYTAAVRHLDLRTLVVSTLASKEIPAGLPRRDAGVGIDLKGGTLWVYGGEIVDGGMGEIPVTEVKGDLWKFDLSSREWTLVHAGGSEVAGPGQRTKAMVRPDPDTGRIWIAGGQNRLNPEPGLNFYGFKDGAWVVRETGNMPDPASKERSGTYDLGANQFQLVSVPETNQSAGQLTLATLTADSTHLGMIVYDERGEELGRDLSAEDTNMVLFVGRGDYTMSLVPLPGFTSNMTVNYTLEATPVEPEPLSVYPLDPSGPPGGKTNAVVLDGNVAYVGGIGGIEVVDISNPEGTALLSTLPLLGSVQDLVFCGPDFLCVANALDPQVLVVVDVSDPSNLQVVGQILGVAPGRSLARRGRRLYLGRDQEGVAVIDMSNPYQPQVVDTIQPGGVVMDVAVSGTLLVVSTDSPRQVFLYEVLPYGSPVLLSQITPNKVVDGVRTNGHELHLSELNNGQRNKCSAGLHCPAGNQAEVFDISDPAAPVQIGSYNGNKVSSIHWKSQRDLIYVRKMRGFRMFRAVPLTTP